MQPCSMYSFRYFFSFSMIWNLQICNYICYSIRLLISILIRYHRLFNHSSLKDICVVSSFWLLLTKLLCISVKQILTLKYILSFLGYFSRMQLGGAYGKSTDLFLKEIAKLLSWEASHFHIPLPSLCQPSSFSSFPSAFGDHFWCILYSLICVVITHDISHLYF